MLLLLFVGWKICTIYQTVTDGVDHPNGTQLLQKATKQSPRWQQGNSGPGGGYGGAGTGCGLIADGRTRDEKLGAPDGMEDERDPDVIPAQFVSNDSESVSFNSSKWPNGNFYDRYPNHDIRPSELLIPSAGATNQLHPNVNQPGDSIKLGPYYTSGGMLTGPGSGGMPVSASQTGTPLGGGSYLSGVAHPLDGGGLDGGIGGNALMYSSTGSSGGGGGGGGVGHHQSTLLPNGGTGTGVNPNDYDINVHTIKNMLMTTRVPESCV
ncbi:hypothetical protein ZHAS_00010461 [Anopheles sinensis]|uniref:Uncharacterized protein n=1 Tax=Anopheles sinensis TaxID=74873 RepID=A0A084VXF9_ANOSI|nr:hypothetical protein ZHAS_00010461 [Anopheles sinensis]